MEPNADAEVIPQLVPPAPTGAPVPEKFVRTLPGDMNMVELGGKPDLAPLAEVAKAPLAPLAVVNVSERAPAPEPTPIPRPVTAPASVAASPIFGEHNVTPPSKRRQSWGAILAVIIIVVMIIVGAFYAWGQRIAAQYDYPTAQQ